MKKCWFAGLGILTFAVLLPASGAIFVNAGNLESYLLSSFLFFIGSIGVLSLAAPVSKRVLPCLIGVGIGFHVSYAVVILVYEWYTGSPFDFLFLKDAGIDGIMTGFAVLGIGWSVVVVLTLLLLVIACATCFVCFQPIARARISQSFPFGVRARVRCFFLLLRKSFT